MEASLCLFDTQIETLSCELSIPFCSCYTDTFLQEVETWSMFAITAFGTNTILITGFVLLLETSS